jgi:hypothetical protein
LLFDYIQFRFDLDSTSDTSSPDLLYFVFSYIKVVPPTWRWTFIIDCSREYDGRNSEQQIVLLDAVAVLETLAAMVLKDTTYYVRVKKVEALKPTGETDYGQFVVEVIKPI